MKFQPTIEYARRGAGYMGTMPSDLRKKTWDMLFYIQEYVVDIARDTGHTQIVVNANPGYDPIEGLAIMASAIYLAATDPKTVLSRKNLEEHVSEIRRLIEFRHGQVPTNAYFAPYLTTFIVKHTKKKLDENGHRTHSNFSLKGYDQLIAKIQSAQQALDFVPLTSLAISPWEKRSRIKHANNVLLQVTEEKELARKINGEISAETRHVEKEIAEFLDSLEVNPFGRWTDLFALEQSIQMSAEICKNAFDRIDTEMTQTLVDDLVSLAPPTK